MPEVVLLGDSMIKNIDEAKLFNAAKGQVKCYVYRGATINQVSEKFEKEYGKREEKIHSILLHVATNNLPVQSPEQAIQEMEKFIVQVKGKAGNMAVSSIVKRYDKKIPPSNIENLIVLYMICAKSTGLLL